ncbi:MAG: hypothetical protein EA401_03875 [Planctomycetota bacterium]|nr:MAG: hypothetical protein EA401_03875 [Planctomycetota bacterium]
MGRPVRCRQCRHVFLVDITGQVRPVITNRLPKPSLDQPSEDNAALAAQEQTSLDTETLDISPALQRKPRPATQRLQAHSATEQSSPQRKTSRIIAAASPRSLDPRIQQAAQRRIDEPQHDGSQVYHADEQVLDVTQPAHHTKRARPSQVFRKRNSTEAILGAMRAGELAKHQRSASGSQPSGVDPRIAARLTTEATSHRQDALEHEPDPDDLGSDSTNTALAVVPPPGDSRHLVHCPHCGESYPYRDNLLDRAVRCRSCQGLFRVFADCSSEPVIANRTLPPRQGPEHNLAPSPQRKRSAVRARTKVVRNHELVQAMSRSMANAMEQAAARSLPTAVQSRKAASTSPREVTPTHGNYLQEHRRVGWLWVTAFTLAAVCIFGIITLIFSASPQEHALRDFNRVSNDQRVPQQRIAAMREQAWTGTAAVQPIIGLRRADIGATRSYALPDMAHIRSLLGNMQALPYYPLYVPQDMLQQAQDLLAQQGLANDGPLSEVQELLEQSMEVVSVEHIARMIDHLPTHADVRMIITGVLSEPHSTLAHDLLDNPPESIEVARFRGDDGRLLLPSGELRRSSYQGLLMRAFGDAEQWDNQWRVFSLRADDLGRHLPPRPQQ